MTADTLADKWGTLLNQALMSIITLEDSLKRQELIVAKQAVEIKEQAAKIQEQEEKEKTVWDK